MADDSRARSIRAVSSSFEIATSLRWTEVDRRRAATSSHAGASPARSSIRTAVRAARTRSSKPASRVRLPGGTRNGVRGPGDAPRCGPGRHVRSSLNLPGWRSWQRGRLLTVSPQVRILPLVQRRDDSPPGGSGAALRRPRWEFESPRGDKRMMRPVSQLACQASERGSSSCADAAAAYPNSQAEGARRERVQFGSNPTAATPPGYPNQQRTPAQTRCVAGANPVPGTTNDARVAQRKCSRMISGRREVRLLPRARNHVCAFLRGGRRDGALPCKQSVAGSTPALSTSPRMETPRAPSPTGRGSLLKPGSVGVRISGRALKRTSRRHSVTNR